MKFYAIKNSNGKWIGVSASAYSDGDDSACLDVQLCIIHHGGTFETVWVTNDFEGAMKAAFGPPHSVYNCGMEYPRRPEYIQPETLTVIELVPLIDAQSTKSSWTIADFEQSKAA